MFTVVRVVLRHWGRFVIAPAALCLVFSVVMTLCFFSAINQDDDESLFANDYGTVASHSSCGCVSRDRYSHPPCIRAYVIGGHRSLGSRGAARPRTDRP